MPFTAGAWENPNPFTRWYFSYEPIVADLYFPLKRSSTKEIPKEGQHNQNRFADSSICSERSSINEMIKEVKILLERQHNQNRFADCRFSSERSPTEEILTEGQHNQNRFSDVPLSFKRYKNEKTGTQRRFADCRFSSERSPTEEILTEGQHNQNRFSDVPLSFKRYQNEKTGTQRRFANCSFPSERSSTEEIPTEGQHNQNRLFLIFFGLPWTEKKLKKELHNQDVDIGTQNTKSCLPSLPSGEQSTEVLNEEKRHNEDKDCPIQNQHEDYCPNSAEFITQDNTKPEVKTELAETSGRGHNDITAFLCHLYNGVGEAAKNLMNISFIFTLYLMSITIMQPIHSLHIGMANQTIHFGDDVILECSFQQKENNQSLLMQWYKGNSGSLTHGRSSSNDEKYTVDLIQQGILYRYILTIINLSEEDFDTYVCQHNFHSTSFALYPSQTLFVYIPVEKEITASVTDDRGLKNVTFSIGLVYPKPSCSCSSKFEMENLQTKDEVELSTDGHLYRIKIDLNFMMPMNICADVIDLKCKASRFSFKKTVRIDGTGCQEDIENDDSSINVGIFLSVVILFIVVLVIISWIKRSKHGRTPNKGTSCATDENKNMLE